MHEIVQLSGLQARIFGITHNIASPIVYDQMEPSQTHNIASPIVYDQMEPSQMHNIASPIVHDQMEPSQTY